ncbi:site-specific integrase [Cryobacterium sp. RTS3]|uniref:tyrosine-type recombinase/integrase n=1 Tax=Cryobacterium sp. RTS3 TaxID=3048643 RepID=UPI002B233491|nr:site-specific integrase [Cryobacterium sp. RTS3]MEB0000578.1 site-specific integrase [Cryobacterium sp. RTS3]
MLNSVFNEVDPTAGDVWDSYAVGLRTTGQRRGRSNPGNDKKYVAKRHLIDFTPIRQIWLRELVKHWGRDMRPATDEIAEAIRAFTIMSQALSLRSGSDDSTTADVRDIQRTLASINMLKKADGERYSGVIRSKYLTSLRRPLQYLRGAGYMDSIPAGFAITADDKVERPRPSEEKAGKALPYRVVMSVVRAIPLLPDGVGQSGALLNGPELTMLYRAALRALIDTGRRSNEICSLKVGCVTKTVPSLGDGNTVEYTLTYDNHKAGRDGRTLPITRETGEALLEWQQIRQTLDLPARFATWLFPSPSAGRIDADRHLTPPALNRALARLIETVPRFESDVPDPESGGYLDFKGKIEQYSFRHSYAQRHADAGVDPDTLRELMDHRSIATTMGYYTVSAKRKRAAIEKLSPMSVDWHGTSAPMVSTSSYEVGSVAVPWGNCTEPSNVKAGGHACPIRFRCSGCSMYRPDPSFLPGMQEHVTQLRATLAMVEMAGSAAPWVLQSMREEIVGYDEIMQAMRARIEALTAEERNAVEDASAALRKVRAQRPMIPLTVIRRTDA